MDMGPSSRRAFVLAVGGALAAGCLASPTLPLPPPDVPDQIRRDSSGLYTISGTIPEPGEVYVLNLRTNQIDGVIADPRMRYVIRDVRAAPADPMVLWYTSGLVRSANVDFEIP